MHTTSEITLGKEIFPDGGFTAWFYTCCTGLQALQGVLQTYHRVLSVLSLPETKPAAELGEGKGKQEVAL